MKFYSELTKKFYDTADDCAKADEIFQKQLDEAEAKKKELAEQKAARAKEVTDAFKAMREAQKKYDELRNCFVRDFGYFHMSFSDPDQTTPRSIFEDFFTFKF